jgi:hypothetical protein
MSGPHIVSWLSVLAASVGLGGVTMRLLVLLMGLKWVLRDVAQADRPKVFCEFARAASGRPAKVRRLICVAGDYDSECVLYSPTVPTSGRIPEPMAGASKPRSNSAVQEHGAR